jgi:hypothetical protein
MTDGEPIVLSKTSGARDAPTEGVPGELIRYQQPKDHLQSNAPLAHESCCFKFGAVIGICSGKSHGDDLSCKQRGD